MCSCCVEPVADAGGRTFLPKLLRYLPEMHAIVSPGAWLLKPKHACRALHQSVTLHAPSSCTCTGWACPPSGGSRQDSIPAGSIVQPGLQDSMPVACLSTSCAGDEHHRWSRLLLSPRCFGALGAQPTRWSLPTAQRGRWVLLSCAAAVPSRPDLGCCNVRTPAQPIHHDMASSRCHLPVVKFAYDADHFESFGHKRVEALLRQHTFPASVAGEGSGLMAQVSSLGSMTSG